MQFNSNLFNKYNMKIKEALSYMAFMLENGHWKKTEKSLDCFNTLNEFKLIVLDS